ncbi:MAG: hypothetical protein N2316_07560 [Spirochaetes bacterium]|nr:hypothetical protein [Spirochaetota bacterium]
MKKNWWNKILRYGSVMVVMLLACKDNSSASGGPPINLFTEIMQFPDRSAHYHGKPKPFVPTREPEIFAERYAKLYESHVAKRGGKIPLEGPEKFKFEKEMMLVQAGLLFDMRLGENHPAKKKFLEIVAWSFDQRMPIIEKRKPYIMAEEKAFKKAEELDFQLHEKLLIEVKKKMKAIFSPHDYKKMTNE